MAGCGERGRAVACGPCKRGCSLSPPSVVAAAPEQHYRRRGSPCVWAGRLFFTLQLGGVIAYQSDNYVINQVLGPEQVTQYAVPFYLFNLAPLLLNLALAPLWPAYAEAAARGDADWVRRTLSRSIKLALLVTGLPALILVLFGAPITHLWVGDKVVPTIQLLLALGLLSVIVAVSNALAMFMNGLNFLGLQFMGS